MMRPRAAPAGWLWMWLVAAEACFGQKLLDAQVTHMRGEVQGMQTETSTDLNGQGPQGEAVARSAEVDAEVTVQGSVYHRNLLSFDLVPLVGYTHTSITGDAGDEAATKDNGFRWGGLFSGTLLKEKPCATSAFYRRDRGTMRYELSYPSSHTLSSWGIRSGWANDAIPLSLEYYSDDRREEYSRRTVANEERRLSGLASWQRSSSTRLNVQAGYSRLRRTEEDVPATAQSSSSARVDFSQAFDTISGAQYVASASWNQIKGALPYLFLFATNGVRGLRLGTSALADISYLTNSSQVPGVTAQRHELSGTLVHQLFESLTSRAGARGYISITNLSSEKGVEVPLDFAYRKLLPVGLLQVNPGGLGAYKTFRSSQNETGQGSLTHSFSRSNPVLIRQSGITIDEVQITSADGLVVFRAGTDYTVSPYGEYCQVLRVPLSAIADTQTVVIRYTFDGLPTTDIWSGQARLGVSHEVGNFLHYGYAGSAGRSRTVNGSAAWNPDNTTEHRLFIKGRFRILSCGVTETLHRSQIVPWDETAVSAGINVGSSARSYAVLSEEFALRNMPQQDDRQKEWRGNADLVMRLGRKWQGSAGFIHRNTYGLNTMWEYEGRAAITFTLGYWISSLEFRQRGSRYNGNSDQGRKWTLRSTYRF